MSDRRAITGTAPTAVIVGTGLMARGIAVAFADAGLQVAIAGRDLARAKAAATAATRLGESAIGALLLDQKTFRRAELVVETVTEDRAIKEEVLGTVEQWLNEDALLTTNTSSLSINELGRCLSRPGCFAGLHFLNPAHQTSVVEIVAGKATKKETLDRLVRVAEAMGKTPLVLHRDVRGFIWNRLQFAVLRECLHLLESGVCDAAALDAAVSQGLAPRWMAIGPLGTADLGGLDTFSRVATELFPHLTNAREAPNELRTRAATGETFYEWTDETRASVDDARTNALRFRNDMKIAHPEVHALAEETE